MTLCAMANWQSTPFVNVYRQQPKNKKFELRLTGCTKACSISGSVVIAENWGVYAKQIYNYQMLYLDHKR